MSFDVFDVYRTMHTQGFVPIFVEDDRDTRILVEGCVEAGLKVIEYTLRRPDCRESIPWILKEFPDLYAVVGSTIDHDGMVRNLRRRYPQLMTLQEIADLGAHGFVSLVAWTEASIRKWSPTHIVCPQAQNMNEAFLHVAAGAHFSKMLGPELDTVKRARSAPTFDFCPVIATGGLTRDRIPETIAAGAVMVAGGFDILLKDLDSSRLTVEQVRDVLSQCLEVTQTARDQAYPELMKNRSADRETWLASLPHYHPF
jgi:2-keto-3-deoxy-6-phosphogluconate aldolase